MDADGRRLYNARMTKRRCDGEGGYVMRQTRADGVLRRHRGGVNRVNMQRTCDLFLARTHIA